MSAAVRVKSSPALCAEAVFLKFLPMVTPLCDHAKPLIPSCTGHSLIYLKAGDSPLCPLGHLSSSKPWLSSPVTVLVLSSAPSDF